MRKATLVKLMIFIVMLGMILGDAILLQDAVRGEYWLYIGLRFLLIFFLGIVFFAVKKYQVWLWGIIGILVLLIFVSDSHLLSVQTEIGKMLCDDVGKDFDASLRDCVSR